jgi:hypothetical protein
VIDTTSIEWVRGIGSVRAEAILRTTLGDASEINISLL